MKCDELRIENGCVYGPYAKVYLAEQVDAAIAELKQKLESVQASMYADVVDAGMENRRLKRALYKACANWAKAYRYPSFRKFESRCLKMAEKYK